MNLRNVKSMVNQPVKKQNSWKRKGANNQVDITKEVNTHMDVDITSHKTQKRFRNLKTIKIRYR